MRTSEIYKQVIAENGKGWRRIKMPVIHGMYRRIKQLEDEFEEVVGYIPGKPEDFKKFTWGRKKLNGIRIGWDEFLGIDKRYLKGMGRGLR